MFATRSLTPELLDQPQIPFADIRQNMRELDTINTVLGGHRITLKGLEQVLKNRKTAGTLHIAEIGCGDGNNLRVIRNWGTKRGLQLRLTGIDYNRACIEYARQLEANHGMDFICSDYRAVAFDQQPDVLFSSLFCHHFDDETVAAQLGWLKQNSRIGFFINDLHRHPFAYHSIKWLTLAFSKSYLVKNDAPLSVLRGFRKMEWLALLQQAGVEAEVRWMWAFRWLVVCRV